MTILVATLCCSMGLYLTAAIGCGIVLRTAGHTPLYNLLEAMTGYLPYASIVILLLVGMVSVLKSAAGQPRMVFAKLLITLVLALIPVAVHMATYYLTYSAAPPPQHILWGSLSMSEWLIFLTGFLLIGVGIALMFCTRRNGVSESAS